MLVTYTTHHTNTIYRSNLFHAKRWTLETKHCRRHGIQEVKANEVSLVDSRQVRAQGSRQKVKVKANP